MDVPNPEQFYRRVEHGMVHITSSSTPLLKYGSVLDRAMLESMREDTNMSFNSLFPQLDRSEQLTLAKKQLYNAWYINFLETDFDSDTYTYLSLNVDSGKVLSWADRLSDWVAVERFKHGDKALSHGISPQEFIVMLQSPPVAMRIFKRDLGLKSEYSIAKYMHVPVADIQNWRLNSVVSGNMDAAVADMFVRAEDRLRLMGGV